MPVRDADTFIAGDERGCARRNRGANGIDGVVSSALGAASVAEGPVVLVIGDLSFYHDLNGLLAARLHAIDATIVVLNNDGGGIFSFLPQAEQLETATFEAPLRHPDCDRRRGRGAALRRGVRAAVDWAPSAASCAGRSRHHGLSILEVRTDRNENVAQHRAAGRTPSPRRCAI